MLMPCKVDVIEELSKGCRYNCQDHMDPAYISIPPYLIWEQLSGRGSWWWMCRGITQDDQLGVTGAGETGSSARFIPP